MPNPAKIEKVKEMAARLSATQAALVSDYRGATVKDVTELRAALREAEATFMVVKNTLTRLAAEQAGLEGLVPLLDGPTAITFVAGDAVLAAKRLAEAAKRIPALEPRGGLMEGRILSAEQARALATLESREALLAQMAGLAVSSLQRAAYLFKALSSRFLALLQAYGEKLPAGPEPAEARAEPEASADTAPPAVQDEPEGSAEPEPEPQPEPEPSEAEASTEPAAAEDEAQTGTETESLMAPEAAAAEAGAEPEGPGADEVEEPPAPAGKEGDE